MAHVRTQIRDRIQTLLQQTMVHVWKDYPYQIEKAATALPNTNIITVEEQVAPMMVDQFKQDRMVTFRIVHRSIETMEDADNGATEIEQNMWGDPTLNGLCKKFSMINTEIEYSAEGEERVISIAQEWAVEYRVDARDPETPIQ